ncbi:integral membrane protein MviN [Thermaerobacter marianensis DSM 12885]|uniref:Probable lipid II flippase MurJ n=1 Tax=Thermaerobacter marianensis (strain ATCC 700841 / DSM 12885 / JCM 10246 / 7p75a) TaxID=644966 RepID=E6SI27_THEM7|nr:murein biosynthesis integral membrane protein MurJ [Thermaerobacter marianensis]ADU50805.1 integral membrane protein MviN [Thermaerobacter marianensis DSM 12885]
MHQVEQAGSGPVAGQKVPARRAGGQGIAAATLIIALLTAGSRALGFLREAVYASVFGASPALDAFLVAQGVPNLILGLVSTAIATAATPVLAGYVASGRRPEAVRTFSVLTNVVLLVVVPGLAVLGLLAEPVVRLMAPGFSPEQVRLAAGLTRVLLVASLFVTVMNLLTGLLHAHRRFTGPAATGIPFNAAMIAAAAFFGATYGPWALAVGFTAGSLLRILVQLPEVRWIGFRHRWVVDLGDPGLRAIAALLPPLFLSAAVNEVNVFVDRMVGSTLGEGIISALNYAFRVVTLPHGLLAMALVQAVYPSLGAVAGTGDRAAFRHLLQRGMGVLTVGLAPMTVALVVLREPIVAFVYGRGSFDAQDAGLTALALAGYGLGLVPMALRDLASRALYATRDSRTPALVAVAAMVVNVAGDLALGRWLGITGLALATTLSFTTGLVLLLVHLQRRYGAVDVGGMAAGAGRVLAAAALAAVVMDGAYRALAARWQVSVAELADGSAGAAVELALVAGPGLLGCAVYLLVLALLRAPEIADLLDAGRRLLGRARRAGAPARLGMPRPGARGGD